MKYRPEYQLDRLRMMMAAAAEGEQPLLLLHLRWLRTMVVDLRRTPEERPQEALDRLALQQRSAFGGAAERLVCNGLSKQQQWSAFRPLVTESVQILTSLDLRGCDCIDDDFLLVVANAHSSSLQRLYLPERCCVTQSTLDRFTQLEELDATWCTNLTNVDFCSATLRVLYANSCVNLTDAGLRNATRLEVLHVSDCKQVTDVSPPAHCLLELDASGGCGIGSRALSDSRRLQVLNAGSNSKIIGAGNDKITTLQPFAQRLRELNAGGWCSALNGAALADATGLVSLSVNGNRVITTVAPFAASLRRLYVSNSGIGDAGLVTATNLVYLNASDNDNIRSLAPFSASLLELNASDKSQIGSAALSVATKLIWVNVSDNKTITTLQSCSRSLRHLFASGADCALTIKGLYKATQLVTLNCSGNPKLTTMEPFLHSLEELTTDSTAMLRMVADAAQLRLVEGSLENLIDTELLVAAGFWECDDDPWCRTVGRSYNNLLPLGNVSSRSNGSGQATNTPTNSSNRKRPRN